MRLAAVTAVLACLLAAASVAFAARAVESKVTLRLGPDAGRFSGAVKSEDPVCNQGRKVRIVRQVPPPKEKIAAERTDVNGRYAIHTGQESGSWYAKVRPETIAGIFCKGDRSKLRSAG